ncbi:hypothetical protein Ae201684P_016673 [Aphanomyces euteiches]|nr:hypothetical protein Ae201684P_016673 [Aphanomyces euteiches]
MTHLSWLLGLVLVAQIIPSTRGEEKDTRYKENAKQYTIPANASALEVALGPHLPALQLVSVHQSQKSRSLRVLCWVNTYNATHDRAKAIKATWGRRCDKLLFMSNVEDPTLPTVHVVAPPTHDHLWQKHRHVVRLLAREFDAQAYDWIFKCDDDTYVLVDNLKYFLSRKDLAQPALYGHRMTLQPWEMQKAFGDKSALPREYRYFIRQVAAETKQQGGLYYTPGGAGYAFNHEHLMRLVSNLDEPYCLPDTIVPDDWAVSFCMYHDQVVPADTRDEYDRERFHQYSPEQVYFWPQDEHAYDHARHKSIYEVQNWFSDHYGIGWKNGTECCAVDSISFHYVKNMSLLEAYFYPTAIQ